MYTGFGLDVQHLSQQARPGIPYSWDLAAGAISYRPDPITSLQLPVMPHTPM